MFVSATPGDFERARSTQIVEQVIRPTGLLDPRVIVKPVEGQIEDLLGEINTRSARGERVLVTTLTKKMAEDPVSYTHLDVYKRQAAHCRPWTRTTRPAQTPKRRRTKKAPHRAAGFLCT